MRRPRRYVPLHSHPPAPSVLSGPDPAHIAALHRRGPIEALAAWPPQRPWTDTYLRCHRTAIYLVLLVDLVIVLFASG